MQDEFDMAVYCLHVDLEELEDYLVLEPARYAIDQKNADTLPFLTNTAVDQALYMSNEICKLVDNPHVARRRFEDFEQDNKTQKRATLSLKRMQSLISMEMAWHKLQKNIFSQTARENNGRSLQQSRVPFPFQDDDMDYLTASDNEKCWIELCFLHTGLRIHLKIGPTFDLFTTTLH